MDDRLREGQRLQDHLLVRIAQGVTGGGLLETDRRHDVPGEAGIEIHPGIGVHLKQAPDALFAVLGGVDHARTLGQGARVDPQIGEFADIGVGHDLERQGGKRSVVGRRALDQLILLAGDGPHRRGDVERAGQVVDHRVEHGLDAFVFER